MNISKFLDNPKNRLKLFLAWVAICIIGTSTMVYYSESPVSVSVDSDKKISSKVQTVHDYLNGKVIKREDAWWLKYRPMEKKIIIDNHISKELGLDTKYLLRQLEHYAIVYKKPEKK